ncbi:MAG: zinc metallopeptidase, partial [Limnochordales bacterium]
MFFYDPTFILLIPALILALYAQAKVSSTFAKYSRVAASTYKTGADVARELLDKAGLYDVPVERIGGHLSDHYDPRSRVM